MFAVTESKKSILDGPGEAEGSRDEMMAVSHRKKQQIRGKVSDDTGRGGGNTLGFFGVGGKEWKKGRKTRRDETKRKVAVKLREVTSYRPRNFHPVHY